MASINWDAEGKHHPGQDTRQQTSIAELVSWVSRRR
jgi:hypothetical protein